MPALHGGGDQENHDDGLAAAHVPLEQAVHGGGAGEVLEQLPQHLLLAGGELEGQLPAQHLS